MRRTLRALTTKRLDGRSALAVAVRNWKADVRADRGAHDAAPKVVEEGVDAAVEAREARLVGRVVVRRPLQYDGLARAELELEEGVLRGHELAEAAREESASREGRQHLGTGAAKGAVPRSVPGEGRRHERRLLIGHPGERPDPLDAAVLGRGIGRLAGPGVEGQLAHERRERGVALPGRGRGRRDQFDQAGDERQAARTVERLARIGGLPEASQVA